MYNTYNLTDILNRQIIKSANQKSDHLNYNKMEEPFRLRSVRHQESTQCSTISLFGNIETSPKCFKWGMKILRVLSGCES